MSAGRLQSETQCVSRVLAWHALAVLPVASPGPGHVEVYRKVAGYADFCTVRSCSSPTGVPTAQAHKRSTAWDGSR